MRRRTFLQTLSLAAAGAATIKPSENRTDARGTCDSYDCRPAAVSGGGAEKFMRPDVHAGDRPSGASFASRSPALGLNGAAGTAHPLATQTAIDMLKRGGSAVDAAIAANAVLGFVEPVSSGLGGDCYAFVWDPKQGKAGGHGEFRPVAEGADARNGAGAGSQWPYSRAGRGCGFDARSAGRMVGAA